MGESERSSGSDGTGDKGRAISSENGFEYRRGVGDGAHAPERSKGSLSIGDSALGVGSCTAITGTPGVLRPGVLRL
jgi:hypothetical protein